MILGWSQMVENNPNSNNITHGIRIQAAAQFLPSESDPDENRYLFVYRIRMVNESSRRVKLLSRRWIILDAHNQRDDVVGEGVVGKQPDLAPGESFEYTSYCPLKTKWGTMEGSYVFEDQGTTFEVEVGRFFLVPAVDNELAVS